MIAPWRKPRQPTGQWRQEQTGSKHRLRNGRDEFIGKINEADTETLASENREILACGTTAPCGANALIDRAIPVIEGMRLVAWIIIKQRHQHVGHKPTSLREALGRGRKSMGKPVKIRRGIATVNPDKAQAENGKPERQPGELIQSFAIYKPEYPTMHPVCHGLGGASARKAGFETSMIRHII